MPPRIEIIGDAEKAAPFIIWAKREWSLREGRWFKHTGTCLIELFRSGDMGFIRLIPETVNGFVGHPRTGKLKLIPFWDNQMNQKYLTGVDGGGYLEKSGAWEEIANRDVYPLTDNDTGTFLLERDVEWLGNTDNYGNCWWSDGESTVSWKSNPNWHFSIDSSINIPGLSRPENKVGELIYYTCFSNNIYAEGDVLAVGPVTPTALGSLVYEPSLVAGAWYLNGILMCCSVVNKVDTLGGYWLGVYKQDGEGWLLVGTEYSTTRLHTPAFISKDGKSLVHADKKYTINADITDVLQTPLRTVENTGSRTIVGDGGYGSTYSYKSSYEYWAGLNKSGEPKMSLVSTKADFGYSSVGNTTTQTKMVPVYRGNPATSATFDVTGVNSLSKSFVLRPNGSYCSATFSVDGTISIVDVNGLAVTVQANSGQPLCGNLYATLVSKTNVLASVSIRDGATWSVSSDYSLMYALNPTGWTIGEYHYISDTVRVKLLSVSVALEFIDTMGACEGDVSEGWSADRYRVAGSYGTYSGCFGAILTTTFLNSSGTDFCYVTTEERDTWQNGGTLPCTYGGHVYAFYATGGSCPSSYPCTQDNGDTVIALIGGYARAFQRQSRRRYFTSYVCEVEVLLC